jgi:hypothetical protein
MRASLRLGLILLVAAGACAQSGVGVEVDEVTDNRMSVDPNTEWQMRGSLELRVKLTGTNLDKAAAARVIVKEAKDDKGNSLMQRNPQVPDFFGREYNNGTLQVSVLQPARTATTVRLKGTVELYVPGRDPNATVTIDKALSKLDAPLSSKALKAAKIDLTPLSKDGYKKLAEARKVTPEDLEKLKAEAKKEGVSEQEIELAVGLAQAFEAMDADLPESAVILSGKKADFDRLYRVEILGNDGQPMHVTSRGTSTRGESSIMTLNPSEDVPANAKLQLMLLTDKSRMSFPFDLKVELP